MEVLSPVVIDEEDFIDLDEEDWTPEERAELDKLTRQWEQEERNAAQKEVTQARRDRIEAFRASGYDIRDYCHDRADSPESAAAIAADLGFRASTWDDAKNITRRAKESNQRAARGYQSMRLKAATGDVVARVPASHPAAPKPSEQASPGYGPSPDKGMGSPDTELAEALPHYLKTACKGLSYTRQAALWELAKAKVNNRRPAPFVSSLPAAARADLDLRLRVAMDEAREHIEADRMTQQRIEAQRQETLSVLVPAMRELRAFYEGLAAQYPDRGDVLQEAWSDLLRDYEGKVKEAWQPGVALLTCWINGAKKDATLAVKFH